MIRALARKTQGREIKPRWENEPGSIFLLNVFYCIQMIKHKQPLISHQTLLTFFFLNRLWLTLNLKSHHSSIHTTFTLRASTAVNPILMWLLLVFLNLKSGISLAFRIFFSLWSLKNHSGRGNYTPPISAQYTGVFFVQKSKQGDSGSTQFHPNYPS